MEKLKFVNPYATNLTNAFGFTPERAAYLGRMLDNMVAHFEGDGTVRLVFMADELGYIEERCETEEERVWCIVNHIEWLAKNGRLVPAK